MTAGFELIHREVSVALHRRDGLRLEYVHTRRSDEEWHIVDGPVPFEAPVPWSLARSGDALLIPLVPYIIRQNVNQAAVWLLAVGIRIGTDVKQRFGLKSLVMVTGDPPEDLSPEGHPGFTRIHIGFAIRTR